jgi:hypothetical protein
VIARPDVVLQLLAPPNVSKQPLCSGVCLNPLRLEANDPSLRTERSLSGGKGTLPPLNWLWKWQTKCFSWLLKSAKYAHARGAVRGSRTAFGFNQHGGQTGMFRYTKANHRVFMQFVRRDVWYVTFL